MADQTNDHDEEEDDGIIKFEIGEGARALIGSTEDDRAFVVCVGGPARELAEILMRWALSGSIDLTIESVAEGMTTDLVELGETIRRGPRPQISKN